MGVVQQQRLKIGDRQNLPQTFSETNRYEVETIFLSSMMSIEQVDLILNRLYTIDVCTKLKIFKLFGT